MASRANWTRLSIYNKALHLLGERRLTSVYEDREPRHVLDEMWQLGAKDACLELVKPRFALKTAALTSPTTSSVHSLDNVYTLPNDFVCPAPGQWLFVDEDLEDPVSRYIMEERTVACDVATTIYVRYVSSQIPSSSWTPSFLRVVAAYGAKEAAPRLNPSKQKYCEGVFNEWLAAALEIDGLRPEDAPLQKISGALSTATLEVYNAALAILGVPELRYVNDESAERLALDSVVGPNNEGIEHALALVQPAFARAVAALNAPAAGSGHGFSWEHSLPADYISTLGVFSDADLDEPVRRYIKEDGKIAADYDPVYLRYVKLVSDMSTWTPGFRWFFAAYLANEAVPQLTRTLEPLDRDRERKRVAAIFKERFEYVVQHEAGMEPPARPKPTTQTLTDAWRGLYNAALQLLDLDRLVSNDDDSERRVKLDEARDAGAVDTVLSKISWNWARTSTKLSDDGVYTATFGETYRFNVPADFVRVDAVSGDEYFQFPCPYRHEGDYFYADIDELYVRYVSNTSASDPSAWPSYFYDLVAAEMARRVGNALGGNWQKAEAYFEEYKREAYSTDAQRNPPRRVAQGKWNRARGAWPRRRSDYYGRP